MGKSTLAAEIAAAAGPGVEVLGALRSGRTAHYRPYDWDAEELGHTVSLTPGFVIVEGLYALRREFPVPYDFTIWVEGELSRRMERLFLRSGGGVSRAFARAHPFARLWRDDFGPREQAYIEAEHPWEGADLIVAGAGLSISHAGGQLLTPAPSELTLEPVLASS